MRLWSLHPRHLDRQGLTAAWREALLAQSVLVKGAGGYTNHPQLERFRAHPEPLAALGALLAGIADDADARSYRFDRTKILVPPTTDAARPTMTVTSGQLDLEWQHLLAKLARRSPDVLARTVSSAGPEPHPLFIPVPGPVEPWERHRSGGGTGEAQER